MSAPDLFALGGRPDDGDDEKIVSLFRQWIATARLYEEEVDDEREKAAGDQWDLLEDAIDEHPADSHAALAIKTFILVRHHIYDVVGYAPLPYIRQDGENPLAACYVTLLRGLAAVVPEIAELVSPVVHEDAVLIDADMGITWARGLLADTPRSEQRREWQAALAGYLAVVASTEAKTDRGRAIKARYADQGLDAGTGGTS